MPTVTSPVDFPQSPRETLCEQYVGKDLRDASIGGPQAIVDLALVRRNCKLMLEAADALSVSFRAHVKSHKTTELTRLQVGEAPRPVRLVASTVAEAENLLPYLSECKQAEGREVNVLYGIPPSASSIPRLRVLQEALGTESVSFLVDHPKQVELISNSASKLEKPHLSVPVFVKIDSGGARAGLDPHSRGFEELLRMIDSASDVYLYGFYCHHGPCYGGSTPDSAIDNLTHEISTVMNAVEKMRELFPTLKSRPMLSVGATPTVTSAQNATGDVNPNADEYRSHRKLLELLRVCHERYEVELHAGVYPFLDLQQLATHARPLQANGDVKVTMGADDIALRILVEVLSVYDERKSPEALIGAGTLALGREPCKSYQGWGVVAPSPWNKHETNTSDGGEEAGKGWIVGRISQEHGILTCHREGERLEGDPKVRRLEVGEKLLVWPNHACICAAGFGWYLIVDSSDESGEESSSTRIVDVWPRWRGW